MYSFSIIPTQSYAGAGNSKTNLLAGFVSTSTHEVRATVNNLTQLSTSTQKSRILFSHTSPQPTSPTSSVQSILPSPNHEALPPPRHHLHSIGFCPLSTLGQQNSSSCRHVGGTRGQDRGSCCNCRTHHGRYERGEGLAHQRVCQGFGSCHAVSTIVCRAVIVLCFVTVIPWKCT